MNPFLALFEPTPYVVNRWAIRDMILNVVLYAPLGVFAYLTLRTSAGPALALCLTVVGGAALSAAIEIVQAYELTRNSSGVDLLCNTAGTAAGALIGHWRRTGIDRLTTGVFSIFGKSRAAIALLLFWCWYQLAALVPALSTHRLGEEFGALADPKTFSGFEFAASVCEWLAVASVAEALEGPRNLLGFLMLLVPARLLIAGRTASSAELAATVAAWIVWRWWLSHKSSRTRWTAGFAIAAILMRGLTPLNFSSSPQHFYWIPLAGPLGGHEFLAAAITLARKSFVYGAAVWLLQRSRIGLLRAALGIAALLALIEGVQVYMPAHTPEITDPLLALFLAGVLALLEPREA